MAWAKLGTTTLGSAGDTIDTGTVTSTKFIQLLIHTVTSGVTNPRITHNGDSASVYARRGSNKGGADFTGTSTAYIDHGESGTWDTFTMSYICNIAGEEKLHILWYMDQQTAGAGTAPNRLEFVFKYVPSPDADITSTLETNSGAGDYDTSSNITVLGTD